jgi:hypothetical protein
VSPSRWGPRSRAARPGRRLIGAVVGCALLITACASNSQGSGTVASRFGTIVPTGGRVLLVPDLDAGSAGWCIAEPAGGGCATEPITEPIVSQQWSSSGPPNQTEGTALTTSSATSVNVGGADVPTRREAGLLKGFRVVTLRIPGYSLEGRPASQKPRFVGQDAAGHELATHDSSVRLATLEMPTVNTPASIDPSSAGCRIGVNQNMRLRITSQTALRRVRAQQGLVSGAMMACVTAEIKDDGAALRAALLLDAREPGTAPQALPAMRKISGMDAFEAPIVEGEIVARRVAHAWLVVSGRASKSQKVAALDALRPTVE